MPHTPHTPGGNGNGNGGGGPPSVSSLYNEQQQQQTMNTNANHASPSNNQSPQHKSNMNNQNMMDNMAVTNSMMNNRNNGGLVNLTDADLNADLNFDAAGVIDDNTNDLNVRKHLVNFVVFFAFPLFFFLSAQCDFLDYIRLFVDIYANYILL